MRLSLELVKLEIVDVHFSKAGSQNISRRNLEEAYIATEFFLLLAKTISALDITMKIFIILA